MFKQYKNTIIITVAIIAVVLIIYWRGKKAGERETPKEVPLPTDTQGGNVTFNPGALTDALHDDINEMFGIRDIEPYRELLTISNSQLVAVYNDWNNRYYLDDNRTLPQAIKHEMTSLFSFTWPTIAETVLERFKSLNLI
jgi:hypothetical protein